MKKRNCGLRCIRSFCVLAHFVAGQASLNLLGLTEPCSNSKVNPIQTELQCDSVKKRCNMLSTRQGPVLESNTGTSEPRNSAAFGIATLTAFGPKV